MKKPLKIIGVTIFSASIILMIYLQNPSADIIYVSLTVLFAVLLILSASYLVSAEMFGKIEKLERRVYELENEIAYIKGQSQNGSQAKFPFEDDTN